MSLIAPKHTDQTLVRLPPGMRENLVARAAANGRSINTEIVAAINRHLADSKSVLTRLEELEHQLATLQRTVYRSAEYRMTNSENFPNEHEESL